MGFPGLTCIKCGEADCVSLDLDDCKTFRCRECNDTYTVEGVADHVQQWGKVLAWVAAIPTVIAGKVG